MTTQAQGALIRVEIEKAELDNNITKLDAFLERLRSDEAFRLSCSIDVLEQDIMYRQIRTQRELSAILGQRINFLKAKVEAEQKEDA